MEKSSNQPSLPHAIIVFNASDPQDPGLAAEESFWSIEATTKEVFTALSRLLHESDAFNKYVDMWKKKGRVVNSFEALVNCYYSSVQVRNMSMVP